MSILIKHSYQNNEICYNGYDLLSSVNFYVVYLETNIYI